MSNPDGESRVAHLPLPATYADLTTTQIKIENVPVNASGVTPIQLVTLYRPGKYNAFTGVMMEEIVRAWTLFDVDDRVKAIVVTGDGKMFCAGADLEGNGAFKRRPNANDNDHRDG
jgi:enoyl-CoA hydratase/carnithine racemase